MAVPTNTVEVQFTNIVANVPLNVPFKCQATKDVAVYYGGNRVPAVYGGDYSVTLQPLLYNGCIVTPTQSLINKITAANAGNTIYVRRKSDFLTTFEETDAAYRTRIRNEFDKITNEAQELLYDLTKLTARVDTIDPEALPQWKGIWQPGTYVNRDLVAHDGSLWIALKSTDLEPTDNNSSDWLKIIDAADVINNFYMEGQPSVVPPNTSDILIAVDPGAGGAVVTFPLSSVFPAALNKQIKIGPDAYPVQYVLPGEEFPYFYHNYSGTEIKMMLASMPLNGECMVINNFNSTLVLDPGTEGTWDGLLVGQQLRIGANEICKFIKPSMLSFKIVAYSSLIAEGKEAITVTANYAAVQSDINKIIKADASAIVLPASMTVTTPSATGFLRSQEFTVRKVDSSAVVVQVNAFGSSTARAYLRYKGDSVTLQVNPDYPQGWYVSDAKLRDYATFLTTSGAITFPPLMEYIDVTPISSGASGASGARRAAGVVSEGGGGGNGQDLLTRRFYARELPAAVSYVLGALSTPGAARTADNSAGVDGGNGNVTSFGNLTDAWSMRSIAPQGGKANAVAQTAPTWLERKPGTGPSGSATGAAGSNADPGYIPGAPSGGGITSGNSQSAGGNGLDINFQTVLGGAAPGNPGLDAAALTLASLHHLPVPSAGASATAAAAGKGGDNANYGGPGAGGGASRNGFTSGAGGQGGPAALHIVIHHLKAQG